MKTDDRRFEGQVSRPLSEYRRAIRADNPDMSDSEVDRLARETRNFDAKHLDSYLKGKQFMSFGRTQFGKKVVHVVKAILK